MKSKTAIPGVLAASLLAAVMARPVLAAPAASYKWATTNPGGAPAGQQTAVIHGAPRDLTDFDIHMACVPGQQVLVLGLRTQGFGSHKPESLRGDKAEVKLLVDGRLVASVEAAMTAWDEGVETQSEISATAAILNAMEKGKSIRAEMPGAKTANISLNGFAALSKAMRRHCKLP